MTASRAAVLMLTVALLSASSAAGATRAYVALGDSYSSGPHTGDTIGPADCSRTTGGYPELVALRLRPLVYANVTCGGATTNATTSSQRFASGTSVPPQADALGADTTLVTVGLGGNDAKYFESLVACGIRGPIAALLGPCANSYTSSGQDQLATFIAEAAPRVAGALAAIRSRAPQARLLLVGYPDVFPTDGHGCTPFADADALYFDDTERRLNAMLATVASGRGVEWVDTYGSTVGHDICQAPARRWVEGMYPSSPAFVMHPNAAGERALADAVIATLTADEATSATGGGTGAGRAADVALIGRPHLHRRRVSLRLKCSRTPDDRCVGQVVLTSRALAAGTVFGRAAYALSGGTSVKLRMALRRTAGRGATARRLHVTAEPIDGGRLGLWGR